MFDKVQDAKLATDKVEQQQKLDRLKGHTTSFALNLISNLTPSPTAPSLIIVYDYSNPEQKKAFNDRIDFLFKGDCKDEVAQYQQGNPLPFDFTPDNDLDQDQYDEYTNEDEQGYDMGDEFEGGDLGLDALMEDEADFEAQEEDEDADDIDIEDQDDDDEESKEEEDKEAEDEGADDLAALTFNPVS
ncbi:20503_t:CDS:2 [Gigaspora rosea]|nr:20503_t:CDS:2 [Gigaspora rosea]